MRNTAANFLLKIFCLVILKEDLLFGVNVQPVASDNRVTSQGCFKSLVELNFFIICTRFTSWNWLKRRVSAKINCCGYFSRSLDDRHGTSPEALGPADIVVETRAKKLQQACVIIKGKKWEVIFWKHNFNCNLQEHLVHFYEVIINCYPKFCFL